MVWEDHDLSGAAEGRRKDPGLNMLALAADEPCNSHFADVSHVRDRHVIGKVKSHTPISWDIELRRENIPRQIFCVSVNLASSIHKALSLAIQMAVVTQV